MRPRHDSIYLFLTVILAALVRLDFLIASRWVIDSDEGIVGLMAKHIADGGAIPIFYYGQPYMGSFEALLAALLFLIFGTSSVALKCVPLMFSLAMVPLMYKIGEALGGKLSGRVAAVLWALAPSPLVVWSCMARGGFIEIVWLGSVAAYLAIRWLKNDRLSVVSAFVIACVLGFGWWVNNQIIYFAAPIGFVMLCRLIGEKRHRQDNLINYTLVGVVGFLVGSLPFWIYNVNHGFASFGILGAAKSKDLGEHLTGLFGTALPMLLGAKRFWHEEDIFPFATTLILAFFALLTFGLVMLRGRRIVALLTFSIDRRSPVELMGLILVTALAAFAFSSYGHLVTAPRYLLPIYVPIFALVGYLIAALWRLNPALSRFIVFALLGVNFCSCYLGGRALPGQPFVAFHQRAAQDHSELIHWLTTHNISMIRTNYWIGYRLAFETEERVRFVVFQEPGQVRLPDYEEQGAQLSSDLIPYVLVPAQAELVRAALSVLGFSYEESQASGYVILNKVTPKFNALQKIASEKFTIATTIHPENIGQALDGELDTRWGSATPQHPGMSVSLIPQGLLQGPLQIRGLSYALGKWTTDFPRGLRIVAETPGGEIELLSESQYRAVTYLREPHWRLMFEPQVVSKITMIQTGTDSFFDWSIAEISLWE